MKRCSYCGCENSSEAAFCAACGTGEFEDHAISGDSTDQSRPRFALPPLKPDQLSGDIVTLVTCRTLLEADLVVSQLEAAGVPAFIPDQFLMQATSWNLNTYGFVRVQVSSADYELARAVLSDASESA